MSDTEEEYHDNSDGSSDEEFLQTDANLFPSQPIRQNQVLELVHHNQNLQSTLKKSTVDIQCVNRNIFNFYSQLRDSCKKLKAAYEQSQRTITQLKVDKWNLSRELAERGLSGLSVNPETPNSGSGRYEVDFNDTVNSLKRQLEKSERDKQLLIQTYQAEKRQWKDHFVTLQEQWNTRENELWQYTSNMKEEYEQKVYQAQLQSADLESMVQTLKSQTTMLLQDAKEQQELLASKTESLKALQSQYEDKELRILNLSREVGEKDIVLRDKEERLTCLRQEFERVTTLRRQTDRRFEQLVGSYSELESEKNRLSGELKSNSEKRDQIYAQYVCADESLTKMSKECGELKRRLEEAESTNNVSLYQQQAAIYQNDFKMEREARQKLRHEFEIMRAQRDQLNAEIGKYQVEMQRMKQDLMRMHQTRPGMHPT